MGESVFSLEKYYRTQPPQQIGVTKVNSVLEYLAFSGAPIYISIEQENQKAIRLESTGVLVDVMEDSLLLEMPEVKGKLSFPVQIGISFGYKRKRAFLTTTILKFENNIATLQRPTEIILTNLRRNPRVVIDNELQKKGLQVSLTAQTSVGELQIKRAIAYEMSQLGICLFVDRSDGLLLPGDKISSLDIQLKDTPVLKVSGVVSRVDMMKHSNLLPQSYEVVILFREKEIKKNSEKVFRSAKRIPVLDEKPCFFSAEHPLFPGRRIQGQIFEISTSGLSCMLEKTSFPVVSGMKFHAANLQLPHKAPREFVFEVAHVDFKSDGETSQFRLGGEFVKAPIELLKDITSYSQEVSGGFIQDVSEDDLDLLWEFMFETNFIYQDKRRMIQSNSKEILQTYHRLMSVNNPIIKKIVYKEDEEIRGHISAIRFYDNAWIIQHLNATKSSQGSAAKAVLSGITDFFFDGKANQRNSTYYVMSFYRPNNLYPAILFGESARRVNNPAKIVTYDFRFGTVRDGVEAPAVKIDKVSIDSRGAIDGLIKCLIDEDKLAFLRATGLSAADPLKLNIGSDYEQLGLFRERHVISASLNNSSVFALCELSSPGLNLSELTNAIYLFSKGQNAEELQQLSDYLISECISQFYAPKQLLPVVMQPLGSERAQSVEWSKVYTCWISSESAARDFEKASQEILDEFKQLVLKFRVEEGQTSNIGKASESA